MVPERHHTTSRLSNRFSGIWERERCALERASVPRLPRADHRCIVHGLRSRLLYISCETLCNRQPLLLTVFLAIRRRKAPNAGCRCHVRRQEGERTLKTTLSISAHSHLAPCTLLSSCTIPPMRSAGAHGVPSPRDVLCVWRATCLLVCPVCVGGRVHEFQ